MSGAFWTSSSNGFLNYMIVSFLYATRVRGIDQSVDEIFEESLGFKIICEGDDGIFQDFEPRLDVMVGLGLIDAQGKSILKIEHHDSMIDATFCSQIFDGNSIHPDPIKALRKFFELDPRLLEAKETVRLSLIKAKAMSYLHMYPNSPIISDLCYKILSKYRHIDVTRGLKFLDKYKREAIMVSNINHDFKPPEVTPEARRVVARVCKIPHATQMMWEKKIQAWKIGESVLRLNIQNYASADDHWRCLHYVVGKTEGSMMAEGLDLIDRITRDIPKATRTDDVFRSRVTA